MLQLFCMLASFQFSYASFNFLIHGDWGWNSENQTLIAEKMGFFGNLIDAKFVIALGDNFYESGVHNSTDKKWNTLFHDVYTASSLQVPWYPILGNHDYRDNIQAQIDRTYEAGETLWTFPSLYYVKSHGLDDGGKLTIVYIDTQILDPNHDDTQVIFENENWEETRETHLNWIDNTLAEEAKTATWLIVCGHYPIYSVGVNSDNTVLLENLQPLLEKHKVHMYIAGHDHNHQYTTMPDGIRYVVSGQSSGRGPFGPSGYNKLGVSVSTDYIQHYFSECGFAYAEVDSEQFKTVFVNHDGDIRYTGVMANPFNHEEEEKHYHVDFSALAKTVESSAVGIGFVIIFPTVVLTVALFLFVNRSSPQVQQMKQKFVEMLHPNTSVTRRSPSSIDDSIRSNVGLTSDMDRSNRTQYSI